MQSASHSTQDFFDQKPAQHCILCECETVDVLAQKGRNGKALRTVICKECGLVWVDPLPHDARTFYQNDYRVAYKGTFTPKPKHIIRAGKVAMARRTMLDSWLTKPLTILDVGSGGGEFAYLLKSQGHDVYGIEPNKGYAAFARQAYNLSIQEGFIQDVEQPDNFYDLITIWHVLEHTENPSAVLGKLYALLKPEGVLVVEVPSIDATCQSPKNTFHEAHIFNFNLATLRKLGQKKGFVNVSQTTTHDGGNITLFFQKPSVALPENNLKIPGNSEKIIALVAQHTTAKYFLTPLPYRRFIDRIGRLLMEKYHERYFTTAKATLDNMYNNTPN